MILKIPDNTWKYKSIINLIDHKKSCEKNTKFVCTYFILTFFLFFFFFIFYHFFFAISLGWFSCSWRRFGTIGFRGQNNKWAGTKYSDRCGKKRWRKWESNEKVIWKKCETNGKITRKKWEKIRKKGRRDGHGKNNVMSIKIIQ